MRTKREARAAAQALPAPVIESKNPESVSAPDFRIERITNWRAFTYPQVQQALYHWKPHTEVEAWAELVQKVTQEKAAVWATGLSDDTITGLGIILMPENALWPWPYIAHVHTVDGAHPATRKAILDAGIAFLKSKGYTQCWAINAAGIPDEAWVRAFRRGGRINRRGSVFNITLT